MKKTAASLVFTLLIAAQGLPAAVFAAGNLLNGGGYVINGQATPVSGSQSGGGYTSNSSGNPVTSGQLSGGSYVVSGGTSIPPNNAYAEATYYSQGTYYSQSSYGGGGGGGGIIQTYGFPTTTASGTISTIAASKTGGGASCDIQQQFMPKSYIKLGASNSRSDVTALQLYLNAFEGFKLKVDGIYKAADRAAVITFQERYAGEILSPWNFTKGTGYVQRTTLGFITNRVKSQCAPSAVICPAFTNNFIRGQNGPEVQKIQRFLNKELGINLPTTGYYGDGTRAAAMAFQKKYMTEILTPNGYKAPTGEWKQATRDKANMLVGCVKEAAKAAIPTPTPATTPAPTVSLSSASCPVFTHNFEIDNSDPEIQLLQEFLNKHLGIRIPATGFFGEGTRAAVRTFQEKYKSEILTPQGFTRGTGMWYPATFKKANLILGCK